MRHEISDDNGIKRYSSNSLNNDVLRYIDGEFSLNGLNYIRKNLIRKRIVYGWRLWFELKRQERNPNSLTKFEKEIVKIIDENRRTPKINKYENVYL